MKSSLMKIHRRYAVGSGYDEIKDPSVLKLGDNSYLMYASIGCSLTQRWLIGRFAATDLAGPWNELEPVKIFGVEGPEVCAPAVIRDRQGGRDIFKMYVQTSCFSENGVIMQAISEDGLHFHGTPEPILTKESLCNIPSVGLYDVSTSDIVLNGAPYECLTFSSYRKVGCGDLYITLRDKADPTATLTVPRAFLYQEDVPFHNHPDSPHFEWGLEGAKIDQLRSDLFLTTGVCFLEKSHEHTGTRQRVFMAASTSITQKPIAFATPFEPTLYENGQGENGHPETVDMGNKLGIIFQERAGEFRPWHLRYAEVAKTDLIRLAEAALRSDQPQLAA